MHFLQDLKLESTFTSELPGDPETKNQRRQVCWLSKRFIVSHPRFLSLSFGNTDMLVTKAYIHKVTFVYNMCCAGP